MIWGETGTRDGATRLQLASVGWLWSRYHITGLRDGDCVGVDAQLYHMARAMNLDVVIHPPTNDKFRAFCGAYDTQTTILPEKGYYERDRDLVNASAVMVACPKQLLELGKMQGGTWYTINYTRKLKLPLAIAWPNGFISYENWEQMKRL
jgi:hypothetical protein